MAASLPTRVTAILTTPRTEWPVIAAEPATVSGLYARYIVPLAAIGPLVLALRLRGTGGLVLAVVQYAVHLATIYLCARVIERLAPRFGAKGGTAQTLKLVAYAATPAWIAALLEPVPYLGGLSMLALFPAVYLYYLGLAPVLGTPREQAVPFMLVSAIVVVVASTVASALVGVLLGGAIGVMRL